MKKALSVIVAVAMLATMSVFAMTSASAETKWSLPLDVTDANWHAETGTNNPDKSKYKWAAPLAEVTDTITGKTTADGLELRFPVGGDTKMTYPHARYENAGGLVHVGEDDYVNVRLSCGAEGQTDVKWSIRLNFISNSVRLDNAIAAAIGAEQDTGAGGTWIIRGGDVEFSLKVSDVAKEWFTTTPGDGKYDAVWGSNGNDFMTGVVFYLLSPDRNSEVPFVVKALTIGDKGDFGDPAAAGSNNAGTADKADSNKPAANNNKGGSTASKKPSVGTGESVLPIVGIAALAVVATSAVVVSRKRK